MKSPLLHLVFLLFLWSCQQKNGGPSIVSSPQTEAESVQLTLDHAGRVVIAWTEKTEEGTSFFYAKEVDGNFRNQVRIPAPSDISTHAEGMPKVAFMRDGTVIAAYEIKSPTPQNKYAGAISYVTSSDEGETWSSANFLHSDTSAGKSRSFFDLTSLKSGEVAASWLDIKSGRPKGGRSIRFAKTNGKARFKDEIVIDSSACECCRIEVHAGDEGTIHLAYRASRLGTMGKTIRDIMYVHSHDDGITFSRPISISDDNWAIDGCPHTGPALASDKDATHALWYTEGGNRGIFYSRAQPSGKFGSREMISRNGRHPQLASGNGRIMLLWEEMLDSSSNSIKYQVREGNDIVTNVLSGPSEDAYYPVVVSTRDGFGVAWLGRHEDRPVVKFHWIR